MLGCTTVMGGLTSWATGGNFLEGAMNRFQIGFFNHAMHPKDPKTGGYLLDELVCTGNLRRYVPIITQIVYSASIIKKYRSVGTVKMYSYGKEVFSCPAVSGADNIKSYTIPSGDWSVKYPVDRTDPKFTRKKVGWTADFDPDPFYDNRAGRKRQYIKMHPARSAGTEGCIGLIDDDPIVLRRARDLMRNTIKKRGSLQLHVIIK